MTFWKWEMVNFTRRKHWWLWPWWRIVGDVFDWRKTVMHSFTAWMMVRSLVATISNGTVQQPLTAGRFHHFIQSQNFHQWRCLLRWKIPGIFFLGVKTSAVPGTNFDKVKLELEEESNVFSDILKLHNRNVSCYIKLQRMCIGQWNVLYLSYKARHSHLIDFASNLFIKGNEQCYWLVT